MPSVTSTTKTKPATTIATASRLASCPSPRRFYRDVDGILLLDKALGVSSNAALQQVRALFSAAKAGHAGSLDPLASGLLPVCFGQATKVCGRLLNSGKTYRVLVQLGARTESRRRRDRGDRARAVPPLDDRGVDAVLAAFLGEQQQVPPMHSALKFEGKRLYELARRGESVERAPRPIVIHRIARVRLERRPSWSSTSTARRAPTSGRWRPTSPNRLGHAGLRPRPAPPVARSVRRPADVHAGAAGRAIAGGPGRAAAAARSRPSWTCRGSSWTAAAVAGLLQGRTVAAAASGRAGELRAYDGQGRFLGHGAGRGEGGSGRSGCSWTSPRGRATLTPNSAVLLEIIGRASTMRGSQNGTQ